MKFNSTCFLCLLILSATNFATGQSSFALQNYIPGYLDAPVFDSSGNRLAGPSYLAELWGSANSNGLVPVLNIDRGFTREIVPFLTDGYFSSSSGFLCVMDVPPSGSAWLQVRAWDSRLGATYEEVQALGIGGYGESPLFYAQGSNPYPPADLPAPLFGLQSFSLLPIIPEPNATALVLLGLALLLRRRGP
jgi:hypothetical protein